MVDSWYVGLREDGIIMRMFFKKLYVWFFIYLAVILGL